jgi:hypothetical protein
MSPKVIVLHDLTHALIQEKERHKHTEAIGLPDKEREARGSMTISTNFKHNAIILFYVEPILLYCFILFSSLKVPAIQERVRGLRPKLSGKRRGWTGTGSEGDWEGGKCPQNAGEGGSWRSWKLGTTRLGSSPYRSQEAGGENNERNSSAKEWSGKNSTPKRKALKQILGRKAECPGINLQ